MIKILLSIAISGLFIPATHAQTMDLISTRSIPQDTFIFGLYDISNSKIHLGIPSSKAPAGRGFHFEFLMQITGTKSETEMLHKQGQGQFAGFGFIREADSIFLHPLSSLKAAGKIGSIVTVNPLLPKPNSIWPAVLPEDLALKIFTQLAKESGLTITTDSNILHSERFTFNEEKNGSKYGPLALAIAARIKLATRYLPDLVTQVNQQLTLHKLHQCQQMQQ